MYSHYYQTIAMLFEWKFTRTDLDEMMNKMKAVTIPLSPAA